jgi:hypothetical protein
MGRNKKDFHEGKEHVMDYAVNPNTRNVHEVVQKGDGPSAPTFTRLTPLPPDEEDLRQRGAESKNWRVN